MKIQHTIYSAKIVDTNGTVVKIPQKVLQTKQECLDWIKKELEIKSFKRRGELTTQATYSI